jgi:hypothetical protein
MNEEILAKIEAAEKSIATLKLRRSVDELRPLVRKAQAEAEVLDKRLELHLPNDQPPPRWVPVALLALPVSLVAWLWLLGRLVK